MEELAEDPIPVSFINQALLPANVATLVRAEAKQRPLHVTLVESLNSTRALLARLELGVSAPPGEAREVIRELYVATQRQAKALAACLELQGLK